MMRKYKIIIFGCQMNHADAERMAVVLENCGLIKTNDEEKADVVVIYSCSVRQMAEDRTYGKITKIAKQKNRPRIIASGCLVSDKIWQKLLGQNRFDLCLPIDRMIDLPKYLKKWGLIDHLPVDNYDHYLQIVPKNFNKYSAYLPIMTGCNNFCSYCAVPYTRGREVSRPMVDIISEAKQLADNGCIELTLLGQNVNSYGLQIQNSKFKIQNHNLCAQGAPLPKADRQASGGKLKTEGRDNHFVELLTKISDIKEFKRIYFISSHPKDMSEDLIKLVSERKNLAKYIHLPMQSGDDDILRAMNRHYTRDDYLNLVKKIRQHIPDVAISTDVIVGFPGETEAQWQKSCQVFAEAQFDMAFIAEYSPRPKTTAAKLKDDVPKADKHRRKKILNDEYLMKSALANNQKLVGKIIPVLFRQKKKDLYIGLSEGLKQVHVISQADLIGQLVDIKITKAMSWGLEGEI